MGKISEPFEIPCPKFCNFKITGERQNDLSPVFLTVLWRNWENLEYKNITNNVRKKKQIY